MHPLPRRYLEIQLRFAATMAQHRGIDLGAAVLDCTNFVRRFGFGHPAQVTANPDWAVYCTRLEGLASIEEQLVWTVEFATSRPTNLAISNLEDPGIGPFSADVTESVMRTHFAPSDDDDELSPLHPSKLDKRRKELRLLIEQVRRDHPEIERIRGTSWLYGTRSYRSLFPSRHVATAAVRTGTFRFQGSSSWGQFLDYRGGVKTDLVEQFLTGLPLLDPGSPWLAFPLPTFVVDSPIGVFDS